MTPNDKALCIVLWCMNTVLIASVAIHACGCGAPPAATEPAPAIDRLRELCTLTETLDCGRATGMVHLCRQAQEDSLIGPCEVEAATLVDCYESRITSVCLPFGDPAPRDMQCTDEYYGFANCRVNAP